MSAPYLDAGAEISPCGLYRYQLWRRWERVGPHVLFVMLNPSTADGLQDDPTIRRCVGFARAFGGATLEVMNLFAFRATDPAELLPAQDPVGPRNDDYLAAAARRADLIVAAWGAHRLVPTRAPAVLAQLQAIREVHCLALTASGQPRHPLYLRADLQPVPLRSA